MVINNFHKDNPAIVLGAFETGLGVVRSLGRLGITVYVMDFKKDIAFYSKYAQKIICPDPRIEKEKFIEFLIDRASDFQGCAVLYITADEFLLPVIQNAELLSQYFLFNLPGQDIFWSIKNKYEQYKLAKSNNIPIPDTYLIQKKVDLNKIKYQLSFPVFLKGSDSVEWRKIFGGSKKGFVLYNINELENTINLILSNKVTAIIQEFIEGPDTNHYKFSGYVDKNRQLVAGFCLQKIRQNPVHFGVGCAVQSVENKQLMDLGVRFFNSIHYRGIGSAEFKLDEKDNTYKLIELNPRYWQQNSLPTACGINFPLIQYLDLTEQPFSEIFQYKTGIKWINIYSDFDSFLSYRKENSLTIAGWLKSLRGSKIYSDWCKDDILPGFYEIRFGKRLIRIPLYILRKIFNEPSKTNN